MKKDNFMKSCLDVKPPCKIKAYRHNVEFLQSGIFEGGWTLVPKYKNQGTKHQGVPAKHVSSFQTMPGC